MSAQRPNWNVVLGLVLAASAGLSESVWGTTVLSAFIYLLSDGSNVTVGYSEGVQGLSALISALPLGWLADRWPRSRIIAVGGVAQVLAVLITGYVVWKAGPLILVGLVLWGVVDTTTFGPSQALYADSVPTGSRSRYYNYLFLAWLLPSSVGPLVSVLMFNFLGNTWTIEDLRPIFLCGLVLELPAAVILFLFDDKKALGEESDHVSVSSPGADSGSEHPPTEAAAASRALTSSAVPYILFTADLIGATGAGMTVKFFPLERRVDVPKGRPSGLHRRAGLHRDGVDALHGGLPPCRPRPDHHHVEGDRDRDAFPHHPPEEHAIGAVAGQHVPRPGGVPECHVPSLRVYPHGLCPQEVPRKVEEPRVGCPVWLVRQCGRRRMDRGQIRLQLHVSRHGASPSGRLHLLLLAPEACSSTRRPDKGRAGLRGRLHPTASLRDRTSPD
uniref:Mfs general substrate transporter n=1 Tax=Tetraselmis sp. GSL018 TaxID=582737 RepID=A0A061R3F8_9CHLO